MFDGKFLVTLLALMISVAAICNFDKKKNIVEGLGMLPSRAVRPTQVATKNGHHFFSVSNMQAQLPPRFNNSDMGANIRYNPPSESHMASRLHDPLMMGQVVNENFETPVTCGGRAQGAPFRANPIMQAGFATGNFNQVTQDALDSTHQVEVTDQMPVGDMTTVSPTGELEQSIVYDRMIFANRNKHRRGQGDWIRGDLPICPNNTGWFQVSANPTLDLNQGAMNVLAGPQNEVTQEMTRFMNTATGDTTVAGMNLSTQQLASIGASNNDVSIHAYP